MDYAGLHEAISEVIRAEDGNFVLADWVVVTASHGFSGDGEDLTEMGVLLPEGKVSHYKVLGLLEYAKAYMANDAIGD